MLWQGPSFNPEYPTNDPFIKMHGHKLYKYALQRVPEVVKMSIDKAGLSIDDIDKVLIHQANGKMDAAILNNLLRLYGKDALEDSESLMPMSISWLGNSSVATVPTLLDLIWKNQMEGHSFAPGSNIVLASVGAGMNINSIVYRFPE
jgi:3-oxoacyl-[acyl-carrier-protein] synthase-3